MAKVNTYCGLHYIVGLAEQAQAVLRTWEKQQGQSTDHLRAVLSQPGEPGPVRLVRTACKALEAHCSEQSGNYVQFCQHLQAQGIGTVPLARFVGNQFNILFFNAGGVYYLRQHIVEFYDKVFGTPNRLHAAVQADIAEASNAAACRALGIIGKMVTGPLWRKLASKTTHISDMDGVYTALCTKFDLWRDDCQDLLDGSGQAFPGAHIVKDDIHTELFRPHSTDTDTAVVLQLICTAFGKYSRRLLEDHLPGGKFNSMSSTDKEVAASVSPTNVISERAFAQLDRMARAKPNACQIALESMILFAANKTGDWLEQQSEDRLKELFDSARQGADSHKLTYRRRCAEIRQFREKQLKERERQKEQRAAQQLQARQELSVEIGRVLVDAR